MGADARPPCLRGGVAEHTVFPHSEGMQLTAHGGVTVRLSEGETTIAINPPAKGAGVKPVRFSADIAIVSVRVPEMEGVEAVSGATTPFVIDSPGAYEHRGVSVEGWGVRTRYGAGKGEETLPATVYALTIEGVTIFIAVGLSEPSLPPECLESLEAVHLLLVPTGVPGMLDAPQAHKLATMLEPNIVVPVGWQGTAGGAEALERFLGEFGESNRKPVAKWSARPKDIKQASGEVVVLEA